MKHQEGARHLDALRQRVDDARREMLAVQRAMEPQAVQDYLLKNAQGDVRLSELFGPRQDLFVVHNMGSHCPYCTLWADGFSGVYQHLADRAAFVISSPDPPESQLRFAQGRGWKFPMVSHIGTTFAEDMGYRSDSGGWIPGVSVFQRRGDQVVRVADSRFSPGDDFCAVWHLFGLLPEGSAGWQPRFSY